MYLLFHQRLRLGMLLVVGVHDGAPPFGPVLRLWDHLSPYCCEILSTPMFNNRFLKTPFRPASSTRGTGGPPNYAERFPSHGEVLTARLSHRGRVAPHTAGARTQYSVRPRVRC